LITTAFAIAGTQGWRHVNVAGAARQAGLDLGRARLRFPCRMQILLRFGRHMDHAALGAISTEQTPRDTVFDLLMHRFDAMRPHRAGLRSLLRALPIEPATALMLGGATVCSMGWLLNAAGVPGGVAKAHALAALWLRTFRVFIYDESPDLAGTMAALDKNLIFLRIE
jgi:hypothetical protein